MDYIDLERGREEGATFGLVVWDSKEGVRAEAHLRRHEVGVELVWEELQAVVVLVDCGLEEREREN